MSMIKQLKDAESQVAAMQGQVTEAHERIDEITKAHAAVVTGKDAEIATLRDTQTAAAADLEKMRTQHNATVDLLNAAMAEKAQVAEHVSKLERSLADPSFIDAAAKGEKPLTGGGEASEKMTRAEANAAYEAIADPAARDKFRADHKEELGL